MDAVVDTSALSNLAADPGLLLDVQGRLRSVGARLIVPPAAFFEYIDTADLARIQERIRFLHDLSTGHGSGFVVSLERGEMMERERTQRDTETPVSSIDVRERLLAHLSAPSFDIAAFQAENVEYLSKDLTHANDLAAREAAASAFPTATAGDLDEIMRDLGGGDWFWNSPFVTGLSEGGRWRDEMRQRPKDFACAVVAAAYSMLIALGAILGSRSAGRHVGVIRAPRRNDWTDLYISACAARADLLLTDDEGQRNKVNFISATFGFPTRAVSLREFVASAS